MPYSWGMSELYTLRMLALRFKRYGLTVGWLRAEAEAGRIPCFQVGRRLLFDAEAVEAALLERARHGEVVAHQTGGRHGR